MDYLYTHYHIGGVKGSMLSSRLLDHVFVSRVSQTRENKRGACSFPLITHHNGVRTYSYVALYNST